MPFLIAFSGQGAQHANMFDLLKSDSAGADWLEQASKILGKDLFDKKIVADNCFDIIYAQLFLAILSVGSFHIICDEQKPIDLILAGYSLGEAAAFAASLQLDILQLITFIEQRARTMQAAVQALHEPTGLAVLVGNVNQTTVESLMNQYACYIAIINAADHYVVGGFKKNLLALITAAKLAGVKRAELIAVALPAHTPLLMNATTVFYEYLTQHFSAMNLRYPILNALTQTVIKTTQPMLSILSRELSETIRWSKVMDIATEYNIEFFLELGPRAVLKNMMHASYPNMKVYALSDFTNLSGLKKKLMV